MYSNNASNQVFGYIVSNIKNGTYESLTKIDTEEKLGEILNVSRVSVRQAIEKLTALKVLYKIQGSGTYVNRFEDSSIEGMAYFKPTYERLLFLLEFRQQFDSGNISLFVNNASEDEKNELYENYDSMCLNKDNKDKVKQLERDFHKIIAYGTHNAIVIGMLELLNGVMDNYVDFQYTSVGPDNCLKWHGRAVEAIKANQTEMARMCLVEDVSNSISIVKRHMEIEKQSIINKEDDCLENNEVSL